MGAVTKILTLIIVLSNLIFLAFPQSTPEERCEAHGGTVCYDCFRSGTCVENGDGTYSVEDIVQCSTDPTKTYCDDSLFPYTLGMCAVLEPGVTNCSCNSLSNCVADPNNPKTLLHCENNPPVADDPCPASPLDLTTCSCLVCSDPCPFVDDPTDGCAKYFVCNEDELIPLECIDNLCFDEEFCGCVERLVTSPEPTTTQLTCPSGCPFVDDPNDECESYFVCTDTGLFPVNCTEDFCFDQESCGCVEKGGPTTCPPGCPFVDDPNDDCGSYFICTGTDLVQFNCTGTSCFDQESCGCVERIDFLPKFVAEVANDITSLQNQIICNSDCPFVDDPHDDCGRHYICDEDSLIPTQCPGSSCFDQAACQCV